MKFHWRRANTPPAAVPVIDDTQPALPPEPSPQAMAEATALIAGRAYRAANLPLSGDVGERDIIRALLGITVALLCEQFPDDQGAEFLETLGADAATHTDGDQA